MIDRVEIRGGAGPVETAAILAALALMEPPGSPEHSGPPWPGPWVQAVRRFERHPGPAGWSPLGRRPGRTARR